RPESNWCKRLCRPLRNHSATAPEPVKGSERAGGSTGSNYREPASLKWVGLAADKGVMADGSWLCRDDMDRARMLDMERRITPVRAAAMGVLGLALLVCGPWLGWWTLVPLGLAALGFRLAQPWTERAARPEYALFAAWAG